VGEEPCYVVDDAGFRRHIPSEQVDRQVLALMRRQIEGNEGLLSEQAAKMLGTDDIFSKAMLEQQFKTSISSSTPCCRSASPRSSAPTWAWPGSRSSSITTARSCASTSPPRPKKAAMAKNNERTGAAGTPLLQRLGESARRLKLEIHALLLAYRDPRTPWYAKVWAALVLAYAFSPIDLIPDFIPVLGYLDDLLLIRQGSPWRSS